MMKLFKVKVRIKGGKSPEVTEGTTYLSLLIVASGENRARLLTENYFREEGFKREDVDILSVEKIELERERVLGIFIG